MYNRKKLPEAETSWRTVLWDAANYIEKHGHCKGVLEDSKGRVCLRGAILRAKGADMDGMEDRIESDIFAAFIGVPRHSISNGFMGVAEWNNAPHRQAGEVISKLREVALS